METSKNILHMIRIRNRETITDDPPPPFKKRQIGPHLELWHYSCVPVSVFNFTLNRFHVAEPNLGSIRGVFQTVLPCVCVCVHPRANLCVRQSVGTVNTASIQRPQEEGISIKSGTVCKDALFPNGGALATLCFWRGAKLRVKGEHLEVQTSWPGVWSSSTEMEGGFFFLASGKLTVCLRNSVIATVTKAHLKAAKVNSVVVV